MANGAASQKKIIAGVVDQALSTGSNFVLIIMVARAASLTDFGWFSIAYGSLQAVVVLQRELIGTPLSIDNPHLSGLEERHYVGRSVGDAIIIASVAAFIFAVMSLIANGNLRDIILALAACAFIVPVQDHLRYVAIARFKPLNAIYADGIWTLVACAGLGLGIAGILSISARAGLLIWATGGLISVIVLIFRENIRPSISLRHFMGLFRERRRLELLGDAAQGAAAPTVFGLMIALIVSPSIVGSLRGVAMLFGPIGILRTSIPLTLTPAISQLGVSRGFTIIRVVTATLVSVVICWTLLLLALPAELGEVILGETWAAASILIPLAAFEALGLSLWSPNSVLLRVGNRTDVALRLRTIYTIAMLTTGISAGLLFRTAEAILIALACSAWIMALAVHILIKLLFQREDFL